MGQDLDDTNVFVKFLPPQLDDEGLRKLFATHGDIVSSKVMVDHLNGCSLGYGFVRFSLPEQAQKAIVKLSGHRFHHKTLLCKLSNTSPSVIFPEVSSNLYLKPLLVSSTEADIIELFSKFGQVAEAKVMVDHDTGESRQIGFVRFEKQDDASAALYAMNGYILGDDQPALTVKYAESDRQRNARKHKSHPKKPSSPHSPATPPRPAYYFAPPVVFSPYQPYIASSNPNNYYMNQCWPLYMWRPPYVVAAEQAMSA
jgi:hypothetical protein